MSSRGFSVGEILGGKYRLCQLVGEGGMGSVWLGRHLLLDRACAVKLLGAGAGPLTAKRERFVREAKIAASVRHANVVDLFDFGETEGGEFFMVMEWLEGESLADRLARPPLMGMRELVSILSDVLSGLAAVHERGIVHRDLKPENIFLAREGDTIIPKLLDFGISRSSGWAGDAGLTAAGNTVGTPHYMSREQVRGMRDLDGRADLYSVGVILYRAACGRFPFDDDELTGLLMRVAEGEAPRLQPLHLDIGDGLAQVIDRALCSDRAGRFASALEMRRVLWAAAGSIPAGLPAVWGIPGSGLPFDSPGGAPAGSWGNTATDGSSTSVGMAHWRRLVPVGIALAVVGAALALTRH